MVLDTRFISAHYSFQHRIVRGVNNMSYLAEEAHYLNIILGEESNTVTYSIGSQAHLLERGCNTIHFIHAGESIDLHSVDEENLYIVIRFSPKNLPVFHQKYQQEEKRFSGGYITKSDHRLRLLFEQLSLPLEQDHLYQLRQEVVLLEIILRQAEALTVENENHQVIALKSHYDKIMLAKKIIEEDLSQSYSIPELAKLVGTNVQYLKKYFKAYLGKTVMTYSTEKKMEYAKELILTGQYRVSDVARMTGYKHSTHFTTAFKKHFGFIPNSLKYTFLLQQGINVLAEFETIIQHIQIL